LPSQPSINRGTLILLAPNATDASISTKNVFFTFQFNPEKLIHSFNQVLPSASGANTSLDSQGLPAELFYLTFELDSIDIESSSQNQILSDLGLHPALAMLELMMQPQMVGKQTFLPIVVFKWGAKRSLAVRIISMSVEEKSFDITLSPTRASVSLSLKVLDATEINSNPGARNVFSSHQNVQTTLVDAYKLQTGQANVQVADSNSSLAGSVGVASGGQSKTKVNA
jgi:hypothetical protein